MSRLTTQDIFNPIYGEGSYKDSNHGPSDLHIASRPLQTLHALIILHRSSYPS